MLAGKKSSLMPSTVSEKVLWTGNNMIAQNDDGIDQGSRLEFCIGRNAKFKP